MIFVFVKFEAAKAYARQGEMIFVFVKLEAAKAYARQGGEWATYLVAWLRLRGWAKSLRWITS